MKLTLLYRGPLASCNYGCPYCPFAKTRDDAPALARDKAALRRFVAWVTSAAGYRVSLLFTPWGEALGRRWYREGLAELSRSAQVARVAIQTNLSAPLEWTADADLETLALWCTYHPGEVSRQRFLARCSEALERGVRFSVGIVGLREHLDEAEALRAALPPEVYVWVNAYKREAGYYTPVERGRLQAVDPLFDWNNQAYPSLGRACRSGESVLTVDGDGALRRCHFVPEVLGNLYQAGELERILRPRTCPAEECRCYIGYVHMPALGLDEVYGAGLLERIPRGWGGEVPV